MPKTLASPFTVATLVAMFAPSYSLAQGASLPNPILTPGAVLTVDTAKVCLPGYSRKVRHTSGKLKNRIYSKYGIDRKVGHYEIDHLIPLSIGGADTGDNLWPESYDSEPWTARTKDHLEKFLHIEVCAGRVNSRDAQKAFSTNWIAAYRRYLGEP